MSTGISANRAEILQIAEAVAREKGIDKSLVIEAMSHALQKAARSRYGAEHDIRAEIDTKSGEMTLKRVMTVVDDAMLEAQGRPFNPSTDEELKDALKRDPDAFVGKTYEDILPPMEFGRVAAQTAKQVINHEVREAERDNQFDLYKDRVGEIVNGTVKRVEYGNIVIDLGQAEGIIRRAEAIPRENLHQGDRTRALIYDVRREAKGPQIFLSRARPEFMAKLFAQEVPEVYEGIIEIKSGARDPGSRAKIAVMSHDHSIDPVGACVGMRGARVQAVVGEMQGEKIDIIPWSADPATFIVNALQPAEVSKVVLDPEQGRVEVVVGEAQLSLAIGRRGQNVRLASQLTGWQIDIMTEAEESERRQKEFAVRTALFMEALDADEMMAQLLATEGFVTVEDIAYIATDDLANLEGFSVELAEELQNRARVWLEEQAEKMDAERRELGVDDDLFSAPGMTPQMAILLGKGDVKTLEDFAGLVGDDLRGWFETKSGERIRHPGILDSLQLSSEDADALILGARVAAGWIEAPPEEEVAEETEASGEETVESVFR
ncbi:MAG: transcription termination/antitermination protein NusA [Hyphomonadaceae bacterium]|nr:MAG: N utilization substance protein A [Caulobacteraceae bacterium]MBT9444427.1 transcription termination/antitermination protein NusA [Hyphomonadaceae bacterium]TPW03035.1 MAG: N utilization substance protein A [Alphaproteobacteria bacterium]